MRIITPSQLKSQTGKVLYRAIREPQYVERNGTLLVITKAVPDEIHLTPWEIRARDLERFYASAKAW